MTSIGKELSSDGNDEHCAVWAQHCNGEAPQSKEELGMARRRKLKKYEVAKILYVYDEGSATLDEIYERTGYTRDQVAQVLPVEEIEKREMMDVLKRYGY